MSRMNHSRMCVLRASLNHVRPCWANLKLHYRYFHTSAVRSDWRALQSSSRCPRYPLYGLSGRNMQGVTTSGKFSKLLCFSDKNQLRKTKYNIRQTASEKKKRIASDFSCPAGHQVIGNAKTFACYISQQKSFITLVIVSNLQGSYLTEI